MEEVKGIYGVGERIANIMKYCRIADIISETIKMVRLLDKYGYIYVRKEKKIGYMYISLNGEEDSNWTNVCKIEKIEDFNKYKIISNEQVLQDRNPIFD